MESYLASKKKETLSNAAAWMNLEAIKRYDISQS
jgi:hypothetical protein